MTDEEYELSLLIGVDRAATMWSPDRELQGSYSAMADWHLDQGNEKLSLFYRAKAWIVTSLRSPSMRSERLGDPKNFEDAVEYNRLMNLQIRSVSIVGWDSHWDGYNVAANVVMSSDVTYTRNVEVWPVIWHGSMGLTVVSEDTKCCFWIGREPRHILGISRQGWRSIILCKLVGFVDRDSYAEYKQMGIQPIELVGSTNDHQSNLLRDLEDTLRVMERTRHEERRQLALWGGVFDYSIDGVTVTRCVIRRDSVEYHEEERPYYDLDGRFTNLTRH